MRAERAEEQVRVVCHSLRSYLKGEPKNDGWHFAGIPEGGRITVMAMRKRGERFLVAFSELSAGEPATTLRYEQMTPAQIHRRLKTLEQVAAR